jgi:aspartate carbamoyltransferase catalytic subunit
MPAPNPNACRSLLSLESVPREQLNAWLDRAAEFAVAAQKPSPAAAGVSTGTAAGAATATSSLLRGHVVANLFYEDSTRTRNSFEVAARRLGADVLNFSAAGSSAKKGESLLDTARTLAAIGADVLVVRHAAAGAAAQVARAVSRPVVNAGDGRHAHPTQGLLDLLTMRQRWGDVAGRHVAIVGDIANSRVARTALAGLRTLGARVTLVGPATLLPRAFAALGAELSYELDPLLPHIDAIMMLRIQQERLAPATIPSLREYAGRYSLTMDRLNRCKPDVLVMHPGPMNRGVEIDEDAADDPRAVVLQQVANGVAVRMAILEWALS